MRPQSFFMMSEDFLRKTIVEGIEIFLGLFVHMEKKST